MCIDETEDRVSGAEISNVDRHSQLLTFSGCVWCRGGHSIAQLCYLRPGRRETEMQDVEMMRERERAMS